MSELLNRLVSMQEAREEWLGGIGRTTVYELIKRGELTQVHVGRRSFLTSKSLAAYVDRLSAVALAAADDAREHQTVNLTS
jgi:excisionase family DNA binding protein